MKLILMALLLSWSAYAQNCKYSLKASDLAVSWIAFKTPLKVGVRGEFKQLGVQDKTATSLKQLFEGIDFNIDTTSIATGNLSRDKKILTYFFQNMSVSPNISGSTKSLSKKVLKIDFNMNGQTREVPLKMTSKENAVQFKGVIDVLDFSLSKSLKGINQACKELHQGKTWSDVEIILDAKYLKKC